MNYYPHQLRAIASYCEGLNALDEEHGDPEKGGIFAKEVPLTDSDGTDFGVLRDEIGVSWSWFPKRQEV
jgi:hypothetical protein